MLKDLFFRLFKLIKKDVNYIGGSETLPAPLNKDDELKALQELENGSMEARNLLIEHNLRLVVYIAKKFDTSSNNIEDMIGIGTIGLVKAINTFKLDKNIKLATYASRCIENEILMHLRKRVKIKQEVSFDEPLNVDYEGNELLLSDILGTESDIVTKAIYENEQKSLIANALWDLKERERKILIMRFGLFDTEELTQKDVADKLGISQSYISRLEKRVIKKLKNKLNKQP